MEQLLVQAALIIIIVRSAYLLFALFQKPRKAWLEIAYRFSILIVALSYLF